jgi:hypothetical protein
MALVTCRACERQVSDTAERCPHCGHALLASAAPRPEPPAWSAQPAGAASVAEAHAVAAGEFHALSIRKLAVLSLCTLGFYELYWFYRNWTRVRERTGRRLSPFWRAFFAQLWSYSLFDEVAEQAREARVQVGWSPMLLALTFFVLLAFWRFPGPVSLVCFFSFLPLIPVQGTINAMAARRGVRSDDTFESRHIAVVAIGGMAVLMAAIGTLLPPR